MAFPILFAIEAGIIIGDYIYHRYIQDHPPTPNPGLEIKVPTSAPGSTIPIFYGCCIIKTPVLAWWGSAVVYPGHSAPIPNANTPWLYGVDMFFVAGIPFTGFGELTLKNIYVSEQRLVLLPFGLGYHGEGGLVTSGSSFHWWPSENGSINGNTNSMGGAVQFLNGSPAQTMVDGSGNPTNEAARRMINSGVNPYQIPGYRGYASLILCSQSLAARWVIGSDPQPPSYAFEFQTIPDGGSGTFPDLATVLGPGEQTPYDVNPMDVIYDLFTGTMGKLGLPPDRLDSSSLTAAAITLRAEGHGMSRCWDTGQNAKEYIDEIMEQVDGVYYEDKSTGKFCVKLIRPDYDPNAVPVIDPSNCSSLDNFAASGWTNVTNKVRITFTDRSNFYRDGTATAINQANAVGQNGEVRETQIHYPGVTTQALADQLAVRELAARSRPLIKCRAAVDPALFRLHVGDVVCLNWPDANLSRIMMRVAAVSVGTLADGSILLDLIQDYYYQWRRFFPLPPWITDTFSLVLEH